MVTSQKHSIKHSDLCVQSQRD